jgi:KipI family sensor histidine kinase inhibitor
LLAGDTAVTVELGDDVDEALNRRVVALDDAIAAAQWPGVVETVPTYRSIQIHYDPDVLDPATLFRRLEELFDRPLSEETPGRIWTVPVCYGGDNGIDLEAVATRVGLAAEDVIRLHSAPIYRIFAIGFAPGFAYLGGLDPRLHLPRLDSPRLKTPARTISIGGRQAAITSIEAPSGWHLLGRTPVHPFDLRRSEPFLFRAGDRVRFRRIEAADFARLSALAAEGGYMPECLDP